MVPWAHSVWSGYAMLTAGAAVHESRYNHVVVSGEGEARVAGKRAVQVGLPGTSTSRRTPALQSTGSHAIRVLDADENRPGMGPDSEPVESVVRDVMSVFSLALTQLLGLEETFAQQYSRVPVGASILSTTTDAKTGWQGMDAGDFLASHAKGVVLGLGIKSLVDKEASSGRVALFGSDSVKAYGGSTVALQSKLFTSAASDLVAQVSANVVASLSSLLITAISGTITSIGGTVSASTTSQLGSARVVGRKYAALTSDEGKVFITSGNSAQLNSTDQSVFITEKKACISARAAVGSLALPSP